MKKLSILLLLIPILGCDPQAERKVQRTQTILSTELRMRGIRERERDIASLEMQYNAKAQKISDLEYEALILLRANGQLNEDSALATRAKFDSFRQELTRRYLDAKDIIIKEAEWYKNAADIIDAIQEYNAAKDEAFLIGLQAMVESFAKTYVAQRSAPANENQEKGQQLIDQFSTELLGILQTRVPNSGINPNPAPNKKTGAK